MSRSQRGAPRSEEARQAILSSVAELLQERGYEELTIEGIASHAGVGKQTIYRWWPSKGDLITECLLEGHLFSSQLVVPNTGILRDDLISWVKKVFQLMQHPSGKTIVTSLVAAATTNDKIGALLREALGGSDATTARLQMGIESGELPQNAPTGELSEALVGAMLFKAIGGGGTSPRDAERLVNALFFPESA